MHAVWHVADDVVAGLMQKGSLRLDHRTWRLKLRRTDSAGTRGFRWVRLGSLEEIPTRAAARRAADRYLERLDPRELHAGTVLDWDQWCDRYIDQVVIAVCGIGSVFLSQSTDADRRRYACLVGITAQPFWVYATWTAGQWGLLLLTFVYSLAWAKGIWVHWLSSRWRPA